MQTITVNPTRQELAKLKTRLSVSRRGHKLLKDKCDELMKNLLDIVGECSAVRARVEEQTAAFHRGFAAASALSSPAMLREAIILPKGGGVTYVRAEYKNLMSVTVPTFKAELSGEGGRGYGYAFTTSALDAAIDGIRGSLPDLLRLAEVEKTAELLAVEIERTRRRVNALEYIIIPQLITAIADITMKLDEVERENTTRLMKIKDMTVTKAQTARDDTDFTEG